MPGHDLCQVKCEQTSDDEIQPFPRGFLCIQQSASLEELAPLAPAGPAATPVCVKQEIDVQASTLEVLETTTLSNTKSPHFIDHLESRLGTISDTTEFMPFLTVKDEPLSEGEQPLLSGEDTSDSCSNHDAITRGSPKSWSQQDMENALDALRNHNMTLTKASATFGIPSTTLWQRAHRLGIDTPKKEGNAKSWSDEDLRAALHALRTGAISANKASKAYGIPSSTLYKIARREGIRLAAPFNAAPTTWRRCDLNRALASIRCGAASVQKAAAQFGIPTGTLYGRCKREGIELSRSNPTPWSEDAMGEALEAVRVGQMSINQAAIHYNLPYSSLYGRFKRCKYPLSQEYQHHQEIPLSPENPHQSQHQDGYSYHQIISTPHAAVQHSSDNDHSNVSYNVPYHENSLQNTPHASASNAQYQDQLDLGPIMYYSQNCSSEIVTS